MTKLEITVGADVKFVPVIKKKAARKLALVTVRQMGLLERPRMSDYLRGRYDYTGNSHY